MQLLFSVLKVVQGGRIRTMVIAHSPTLKPRLKWLARAITIARMLCTVWDLFVHRNFRQGGGGVIGFPILYRKRKFMGILPKISGFYNFYEVFAHS